MSYQKNRSIKDGIEVLNALASAGKPLGSRELARILDMESTRTNRILKTLTEIGMAQQDASKKYLPGAGVHVLASSSMRGSALLKTALPVMQTHRNPKYVMALGVLWRDKVSYLIHAKPAQALIEGLGGANLFPAETSSIGKVLTRPPNGRRYCSVKQNKNYSVAVAIGKERPVAAVAYAGVPKDEIKQATDELRIIAEEISDKLN